MDRVVMLVGDGLVKPATLQLLMRHASIETTMMYYVDTSADDVAEEVWSAGRVLPDPSEDIGNDQGGTSGGTSVNRPTENLTDTVQEWAP